MTDTVGIVLRFIFFVLDYVVYWLVDQVYWLFSLLSQATLFTQEQITSFSDRIYVLVSIIMMFKLGFSFINYIVNPDSITDKQKGGGKLVTNIVFTIALLVSVPTIFNEAYYVQNLIFENKVIDKVILGDSTTISSDTDKSKLLSVYTFLSFFRPTVKLAECQNYEGIELSDACIKSIDSKNEKKAGTAYATALRDGNLDLILNSEIVNITAPFVGSNGNFYQTTEYFLFDYHYLVSTIVGGFLAWILLGFCLDLAVRSVKLGFLQIIAPVPILLSLTPGKKNNTLSNWGKECLSTWASLFVRVGIISFALNLILMINNGGGIISFVTGGQNNYPMVTVFITIGILLFAKEFPKLLEDILGIKASGKLTLNPLKKLKETPIASGLGAATGAALGAGAANFIGKKGNIGQKILSGVGGTFGGLNRGLGGVISGKKPNEIYKNAYGNTVKRREQREDWKQEGSTFGGRAVSKVQSTIGAKTQADKLEAQVKGLEEFGKETEALFNRANKEMIKHDKLSFTDSDKKSTTMEAFKSEKEKLASLRSMDISGFKDYVDEKTGNTITRDEQIQAHADAISKLQTYVAKTEKNAEQAYVTQVMSGGITGDGETSAMINKLSDLQSVSSNPFIKGLDITSGEKIKESKDLSSTEKATIEKGKDYRIAQANKNATQNKK